MWSKVDELNAAILEQQLKNCALIDNLAKDMTELEKKYSELKTEVNKLLDESAKKVQMQNYTIFQKEMQLEKKYEAKVAEIVEENKKLKQELGVLKEGKVQMVEENKKLKEEVFVLKHELAKMKNQGGGMEEWKVEKKKLEYALHDLFIAHHAKKEKLEKISLILGECNEM